MHWQLLATSALLTIGCAKRIELPTVPPDLPLDAAGVARRHLLVSPSSTVLGRFASRDTSPLDETSTRQTACGAFFDTAEITLDDDPLRGLYTATPGAAARWDIHSPGSAQITVWREPAARSARIAGISDPEGLAQCCAAEPAACDEWFVSLSHVGAGTLAWQTSADGWLFGTTTEEPAPFAFELSANPYATDGCGAWQRSVPRAIGGAFFLGVSNATFTEENARRDAITRATQQASELVRSSGRSDVVLDSLREERWCIDTFPGAGGTQHLAHVLLYLPLSE